ncbi:MAG: hypothetical protein JWN14_651 [Chthonomonadales bacterium]|nr:hypothetical protein [Chthonomonadales bacterium]
MKRKTKLFVLILILGIPTALMLINLRREWATRNLIQEIHNKNVPGALAALRNGANPNARDYSKETPLSPREQAQLFLAHLLHPTTHSAPDTYPTPLMLIAKSDDCPDNPALVKALLDAGADPNVEDEDGRTPLMQTACQGDMRLLNLLLKHKVELRWTDKDGCTALHLAAKTGMADTVESLLVAGSDLEGRNKAGKTSLHEACKEAHIPAVQALLRRHGNLNATDNDGNSPLHVASTFGDPDFVDFLLKAGADIEAKDHAGWTALHMAASYENYDVVQVLLRHHADLYARATDGKTALDTTQNRVTIQVLRQAGGKTGQELDAAKKAHR